MREYGTDGLPALSMLKQAIKSLDPSLSEKRCCCYVWEDPIYSHDPILLLDEETRKYLKSGFHSFEAQTGEELKAQLNVFNSKRKILASGALPGYYKKNQCSIVDIPGSGDGDFALTECFRNCRSICDRLFYLPEVSKLFTRNTIEAITDPENFVGAEFGVIIPRYAELQEENDYVGDGIQAFKAELNYLCEYTEVEKTIKSVAIYCLDNHSCHLGNPQFDQLLNKFITESIGIPAHKDLREQINKYLNEGNQNC